MTDSDPDLLLSWLRIACERYGDALTAGARDNWAAQAHRSAVLLDRSLSRGGPLPTAWMAGRDQRVPLNPLSPMCPPGGHYDENGVCTACGAPDPAAATAGGVASEPAAETETEVEVEAADVASEPKARP